MAVQFPPDREHLHVIRPRAGEKSDGLKLHKILVPTTHPKLFQINVIPSGINFFKAPKRDNVNVFLERKPGFNRCHHIRFPQFQRFTEFQNPAVTDDAAEALNSKPSRRPSFSKTRSISVQSDVR
jgi:hypothetical protein